MEPWPEEVLPRTNQERQAARRSTEQQHKGAGAAAAAAAASTEQLLQEAAPSLRREMAHTLAASAAGESSVQDETGEKLDEALSPEPAGTKLQLLNGFRSEDSPEEAAAAAHGEDRRPQLEDHSGPAKDGSPTSPAKELGTFERGVQEGPQLHERRRAEERALMAELSELVQNVVKRSSWWDRHGLDDTILALNFVALLGGEEHASAVLLNWEAGKGIIIIIIIINPTLIFTFYVFGLPFLTRVERMYTIYSLPYPFECHKLGKLG